MGDRLRGGRAVRKNSMVEVTVASLLFAFVSGQPAMAADRIWLGVVDGFLFNSDNWFDGVPGPGDTVVLPSFAAETSLATDAFYTSLTSFSEVGGVRQSLGAPNYGIDVFNHSGGLEFAGSGLVNESGSALLIRNLGSQLPPLPNINRAGRTTLSGNAQISNTGSGSITLLNAPSDAACAGSFPVCQGQTRFEGSASAGNAFIINPNSSTPHVGGEVRFLDSASAGTASISGRGEVIFSGPSSASSSSIVNVGDGVILSGVHQNGFTTRGVLSFRTSSNAGSATIRNVSGELHSGQTQFLHSSNALFADIVNDAYSGSFFSPTMGGTTVFRFESTAGAATITNSAGSGVLGAGGQTTFEDESNATAVTIHNEGTQDSLNSDSRGRTIFSDSATAASAIIVNGDATGTGVGGAVYFEDQASGANATIVNGNRGLFSIAGLTSGGTTVGSIEGLGGIDLGGNDLTTGGNAMSTSVGGTIVGSGALHKVGSGALTLAGSSSYSGGTTVDDGGLIVANPTGSATGTGPLLVAPGALMSGGDENGVIGFVAGDTTIQSGATLSPGLADGMSGKLGFGGDLTLGPDTQLNFDLPLADAPFAPLVDYVSAQGLLTLDGILNIDTQLGFGGQGFYLIFQYFGGLIDNGLEFGSLPSGYMASDFTIDTSILGSVILRVTDASASVPEPGTLVLMLITLFLIAHPILGRRHVARRRTSPCKQWRNSCEV